MGARGARIRSEESIRHGCHLCLTLSVDESLDRRYCEYRAGSDAERALRNASDECAVDGGVSRRCVRTDLVGDLHGYLGSLVQQV